MFYFYLFVPIFALFYFALRGFIRLDFKIALVVISFLCSSTTLFIYKGLEGDENYKLINDKEISGKGLKMLNHGEYIKIIGKANSNLHYLYRTWEKLRGST